MEQMKQLSWRHHYLPQFYLRGFTNSEGKLKIYDVEKQRFIKDGKSFSTESFFFEKDGNTLFKDNTKEDFIESKIFKENDQLIANLFNKINSAPHGTNFGLSDDDMPMLQFFVAIIFWRVPVNFSRIKSHLNKKEFKELGIKIVDKDNNIVIDSDLIKRLKEDINFAKAMKALIPYNTYPQIFNCKSFLKILSFPQGLPGLCSDNPVVFRNSINPNVYTDDFIFPLSSDKVFFRANKFNDIVPSIKVLIDLILFNQAVKYVSCTDVEYIHELSELKTKYSPNFDKLRNFIFMELFD
jgi:hypothetical protein